MSPLSSPRLALVTGAAGGLGLAASQQLALRGFNLILADINDAGLKLAQQSINTLAANSQVETLPLDLSDWQAVTQTAQQLRQRDLKLDVLINNAGIFPSFVRQQNKEGCELGLAISFYGHYLLTAGLLPCLLKSSNPRVISASSIAHSAGHITPDDPLQKEHYDAARAYSNCKIASLIFARQLARVARANGSHLISVASHPGISRTTIGQQANNPARGLRQHAMQWATRFAMSMLGQDVGPGAASIVYAACVDKLENGSFIGPGGWLQFKGPAKPVNPRQAALARHDEKAIWQMAEQVTGQTLQWPQTESSS